jgi:large subunit ribosomal protein L21
MYAVIEDSGKQFKVSAGDTLRIDRPLPEGGVGGTTVEEPIVDYPEETITFDRVLMVGGNGETKIGTPVLEGVTVTARVDGWKKDEKLRVVKVKRRKGYHIEKGHRQKRLQVQITDINA